MSAGNAARRVRAELGADGYDVLVGPGLRARGDLAGALQAFEAALRVNPHMPQAEDMVASLRQRLSGRAL